MSVMSDGRSVAIAIQIRRSIKTNGMPNNAAAAFIGFHSPANGVKIMVCAPTSSVPLMERCVSSMTGANVTFRQKIGLPR